MDEVPQPLEEYASLADFFARPIKAGSRPISQLPGIVSPVDGRVLVCGEILGDELEQIKGKTYSLQQFLGTDIETLRKYPSHSTKRLYQIVIYLSPGDYHRIHFPVECLLHKRCHFPGTLFPVNYPFLKLIPRLFALNERIVLMGEWMHGFFSLTAVGAYNVGSISINFDNMAQTNKLTRDYVCPNLQYFSYKGVGSYSYQRDYDKNDQNSSHLTFLTDEGYRCSKSSVALDTFPFPLSGSHGIVALKGQELGQFHFGSTVVLIFESEPFNFVVGAGQYVKMGERIGYVI